MTTPSSPAHLPGLGQAATGSSPALRLRAALPASAFARLESSLQSAPDAAVALQKLDRLLVEQDEAFHRLAHTPFALPTLVTLFCQSNFLGDEVLREPGILEQMLADGDLMRGRTTEDFADRLEVLLASDPSIPVSHHLALFRRRELLRIVLRDVQGMATLGETTAEISSLADAILDVAYRHVKSALFARHGIPRLANGGVAGLSVIALGKLGGRELNYSSDIDLSFVHAGSGETDGPEPLSNQEFFTKLARDLTQMLSAYTPAGVCYRVDLRLRPEGRHGEVVISVEGAQSYYSRRARDWELQMLIKGRVAAGEVEPGRALLDFVEPMIYRTTLDFASVEAVAESRARIAERNLARQKSRQKSGLDVKLERGGIRDIEFLVQCLQRLHGGREFWVRHGGTLLALARLRDKELLSVPEYSVLSGAYQFFRAIEHRLQFADDAQTHLLPLAPHDLEVLARRLPPPSPGATLTAARLLELVDQHLSEVQSLYDRIIHAQRPRAYVESPPAVAAARALQISVPPPGEAPPVSANLLRLLDTAAPEFARTLRLGRPRRNLLSFESFLESVAANPTWLGWLNDDPVLVSHLLDLFENSPFLSDHLTRTPAWLGDLRDLRFLAARQLTDDYREAAAELATPTDLRLFFRREMFRLQAASLALGVPVFKTLEQTSLLADSVIRAAYQMAIWQVAGSHPPVDPGYTAHDQLLVIALGRLGVKEFDLGSDADLVFVLPDLDAGERVFWTRVAERMIELLTAYTGGGKVLSVDTRLRPNGEGGPLVQSASAIKEYFEYRSEAWEGIAYMKARAVAGDPEEASLFLNHLQELDFRRYGQSGRSRPLLKQMRLRIEREQGGENPLKAGRGGYYDIDFSLMYLRLKGAGIFFKTLNTPERIDIVEKMGHLERADARFLLDAATLYRAVDHGLRLLDGQAAGSLPTAAVAGQQLAIMVARWTPDHLHDQPLAVELTQIESRTRDYFERLFG
ncbi:MAG: glutamine-synthetase adenylyltransferase [Bryobacteraceae bacterium]|nr:glutamine-synthetase adenylyltransferase [Bryobacteraceae bacterium]